MGLVARGTIHVIRGLGHSASPEPQGVSGLRTELMTTGQWFNQPCPSNGTFIKPYLKGFGALLGFEHIEVLKG